ncbi:hypothetical protein BpHYR1_021472 [Brachionus plicatilis]|uniref:Uncharacterized protein n=1 Tax=Brachionus plicatilis TaxID=10195 RepID=A0A3M7P6K5_BRAPC|nr:hypothetical protein BpHYR1_021472 [Brachionus plicatilis]
MKYLDQTMVINTLNALVDRCCDVNASEVSDEKLSEDVMTEIELMKKNELVNPITSPYQNPYSFKWSLLESYLEKLNDSFFYKHVQNVQALLSIYLNYGLWNEAMDIVKEMVANWSQKVDSTMAKGTVAMPFNLIDTLNKYCKTELKKDLDQSDLKKINADLHELINNYVYQVKLSSESYINLKNK